MSESSDSKSRNQEPTKRGASISVYVMKSRVCAPAPTFPPFVFLAFLGCLGLGCLAGCKGDRLLEPDQTGAGSSATTNTKATAAVPPPPSAKGPKIQFVKAAGGEVAPLVKTERENAGKNQRSFLVYVGASWCEPCQRFHEAAAHGELDPELPAITLLEFDADNDT